jgi:hypothetical protein
LIRQAIAPTFANQPTGRKIDIAPLVVEITVLELAVPALEGAEVVVLESVSIVRRFRRGKR